MLRPSSHDTTVLSGDLQAMYACPSICAFMPGWHVVEHGSDECGAPS